jgi:hypothetical protein
MSSKTYDDDGYPTSSGTIFAEAAEELRTRLSHDASASAAELVAEARALEATFRRWETDRPASDARFASIQALLELNRRARELFSRTSSSPPPAPTGQQETGSRVWRG